VGDDTYEFSGALFGNDEVIESAGGGNDTIHILSDIPTSAVRLVGGYLEGSLTDHDNLYIYVDGYGSILIQDHLTQANIEWLQIGDNAPISLTGGLVMTGSASSEAIYGTRFNDTINGMGGNDRLHGDLGDDTYIVNNTGVTIFEDLPNGNDTVNSTVTYTLSTNLENLNLMGTEAINGTGNDLNNNLAGNSADNQLDGGLGKDTMIGGLGNDTYVIDNIDDVVTEKPDEGTDTVKSSITYALLPDSENLTLTGTTAINGTGNSLKISSLAIQRLMS
jgi:Ca2+-binding RTX toxin-like protein